MVYRGSQALGLGPPLARVLLLIIYKRRPRIAPPRVPFPLAKIAAHSFSRRTGGNMHEALPRMSAAELTFSTDSNPHMALKSARR